MAVKRDACLLQEPGPELDTDDRSLQFPGTLSPEEPPSGRQQAEWRPDACLGAPEGAGNTVSIPTLLGPSLR
jgi:hypothetical protein